MGVTEEHMTIYANLFEEAALEAGKTPEEAAGIKNVIVGYGPTVTNA